MGKKKTTNVFIDLSWFNWERFFIAVAILSFIGIFSTIGYCLNKESKRYSYQSETFKDSELIVLSMEELYYSRSHHVKIEFRDTRNFNTFFYTFYGSKDELLLTDKGRITANYTKVIVYKDGKFYENRFELDQDRFHLYVK